MNSCPCKQAQLACSTDGMWENLKFIMIYRWIKKGIPLGEGGENIFRKLYGMYIILFSSYNPT